jgi:group I intron endonuclease
MVIYKATNEINDKSYIGKTIYSMDKRKKDHQYKALKGSKYYFHRALKKYGFDNFNWVVVEECINENDLSIREEYWISKCGDYNIMKSSIGPGCNGYKDNPRIDEIRKTISKGVRAAHKRDPSIRDRISKSRLEVMKDPNVRKNYCDAAKKRCNTKQWKERQSKIATDQMTEEKKEKMLKGLRKAYTDPNFLDNLITKQRQSGGAYSKEIIDKRSNSRANDWLVSNEEGEFIIHNLNKFCKEKCLSISAMSMVASGKRNHHKGWVCKRIKDENGS